METRSRAKSLNIERIGKKPNRVVISSDSEEDGDDVEDVQKKANSRHFSLDEACKVSGKEVYGFKTPKRKGQMCDKASHSASSSSQKTSSVLVNSIKRGRGRPARKASTPVDDADPKSSRPTPHSVRRKIKKRLVKMVVNESDGDVEDVDESSDNSSLDCSASLSDSGGNEQTCRGRRVQSRPADDVDVAGRSPISSSLQLAKAEDYFVAHDKKSKTSDNTLSRLQVPRLDQQTVEDLLKEHPQSHDKRCKTMLDVHRRHFSKWIFQMSHGYNLLLYGLGSKMSILDEFREWLLSTSTTDVVLIVNGFFPAVTVKNILNSITQDILDYAGDFARAEDQVSFIAKTLAKSDVSCVTNNNELYLLINNIDGATLRNEKAQSLLCSLAQVNGVHVLATIDHINAPLLWDQARLSGFNWVWYDATTYLPYVHETSYENSLLVRQSGSLVLTSVSHVFQSLTPNAKGIFLLIADYQLEHKEQTNFIGLVFQDCYQKCREAFLVNSELTLRAQLTEFKDHKLIRVKKGVDGGEYLQILLDTATLEQFKKQQSDSAN